MKILKSGVNTNDATAYPQDIAEGQTAYVGGEKITGEVPVIKKYKEAQYEYTGFSINDTINTYLIFPEQVLFRKNAQIHLNVPSEEYGDASVSDVVAGKTFTSSAGFKVKGTASLTGGTDTSDATATASDIVKNKTAYVNGEKIKGTVEELVYGITPPSFTLAELLESDGGKGISAIYSFPDDYLMRSGAEVSLNIKPDQLGDATPADVIAGKTFTSSSGRLITGTGEAGAKVASGTRTVTSNSKTFEVTGIGFKPKWFILLHTANNWDIDYDSASGALVDVENNKIYRYMGRSFGNTTVETSGSSFTVTNDSITLTYGASYGWWAQLSYMWFAIG